MVCSGKQNCPAKSAARCSALPVSRAGCDRELTWVDMVGFYPAARDCLAAFLVASAAEVLAGVKPANLIRIAKRKLPCGRCMFRLWQKHGKEVLKDSPLYAIPLREEQDAVLLLLYRPELLEKRLQGRTMRTFLVRHGYPRSLTLANALRHLQQTFRFHDIPDEVGMFLGYPVKDVKGFMEQNQNPWQGRCLWRVYGPPARSLRLYQRYCRERRLLTTKLVSGSVPLQLLQAA